MGLYTSAFKTETLKGVSAPGTHEIYIGLTLGLPSGTKRWAEGGLAATATGQYEGRILSLGQVPRAVDVRSDDLQGVETILRISDGDRTFARDVAKYRSSLRRSTAVLRALSPNVSDANAFTALNGILTGYHETSLNVWQLWLSPDKAPLELSKTPTWAINTGDFSAADGAAQGKYVPIVYGAHDSVGITNKGALPTLYVDRTNFVYAVGVGVLTIPRVYVDGVLQTSGYTIVNRTTNGKLWTGVDFTSDQADAAVTVDVSVGLNGLTNPADQLLHYLRNFVYNRWWSGAFYSGGPFDTTAFTESASFLTALGHEGSRYIESGYVQKRAIDVLNEWAASHGIKPFWKNNGNLAIRPLEFRQNVVYFDDPYFVEEDEHGAFAVPFDTQGIRREFLLNYLRDEVAGSYTQSLRVQDLSVAERVSDSQDLPWSAARVL